MTLQEGPESAAQNPPVQVREQHVAPELQNAPVSAHTVLEQVPPTQVVPQQFAFTEQLCPLV